MISTRIASRREGRSQTSLETRKDTLDLPALAKDSARKVSVHQPPIHGLWLAVRVSPEIDRDRRGCNPEFLSTECMKRFGIVGRIGEHAFQVNVFGRLSNRRLEARRIIARAKSQIDSDDQMCGVVAGGGKLGKTAETLHAPLSLQKVTANVSAFKSRSIDRGVNRFNRQTVILGVSENSAEQAVEAPLFNREFSTFCSVVK